METTIRELWAHQKEAVKRALECDGKFGFFFEVGAGKSSACIHTCRQLYNKHGRVLRTLIVSPVITLHNWKNEWLLNSKLNKEQIVILQGTGLQKAKQVLDLVGTNKIVVTNYEALLNPQLMKALEIYGVEILILDESQRIKAYNSKRTKCCHILAKQAMYRMILSGTPILKNTMDIWSQYWVLDHGQTFGDTFYRFKLSYFYDKNAGMPKQKYFPNWQPRPERAKQLEDLLAKRTMTVKKEDCLDLPPFVRQAVHVELEGAQKTHYVQMKNFFVTYLEDQACVATIALTKGLRMLQIISGHMPLDNGEVEVFEGTPRQKALEELLQDIAPNHKVIVWAVFKPDYKVIADVCKKLCLEYRELHGEVKEKDKFANVEAFNKDDMVRVMIANPSAGGVGINMVSASYAIYYSRNYSLESDLQSEARNYRAGSERHEKITRIDIVAKDTLDEVVLKALQNKKEIGEQTLRAWALE